MLSPGTLESPGTLGKICEVLDSVVPEGILGVKCTIRSLCVSPSKSVVRQENTWLPDSILSWYGECITVLEEGRCLSQLIGGKQFWNSGYIGRGAMRSKESIKPDLGAFMPLFGKETLA